MSLNYVVSISGDKSAILKFILKPYENNIIYNIQLYKPNEQRNLSLLIETNIASSLFCSGSAKIRTYVYIVY